MTASTAATADRDAGDGPPLTDPVPPTGPGGPGADLDRRRLVAVAVTVLLAAVAGLELRRLFGLGTLLVPVAGAALAGAAGALLVRWRRLPALLGPVVSIVAGLVVVGASVDGSGAVAGFLPGPELVRTVHDAVVNGWAQILSTGIPAPPRASMVLVAPMLAWAASWLGSEIVLRTRAFGLGALPPVAALVVASVLVVPADGSRLPGALLLAVGAGVLVVVGAEPDGPRGVPGVRPVRAGATGLAVVVGGALLAPHLPWIGDAPTRDPRPAEPTPEEQVVPVNPLALLAGWAAAPDAVVATVEAERPVPLRLMVLDRFDGTAWRADTTLQEAGSTLPPLEPGDVARGTSVTQRITLEDLPGSFLPTAERPVRFDGPEAWWDARHGILYRKVGAAPADDLAYEVRSVVPDLPAQIGDRGVDVEADHLTAAPGAPPELASLSLAATPAGTAPYAKALQLEAFVRERGVFDAQAPSGTSWATLEYFLLAEADAGGRRGTSEQFATAFATLGRLQGLPTRVVVGARPGEVGDTWEVRAGDLEAWPEVRFAEVGWVAFDPTPAPSDQPPPATTTTPPPPPPPPPPVDEVDPERTTERDDDLAGPPAPGPTLRDRLGDLAVPSLLALVVLVVAAPFLVAAAKALRRAHRRRSTTPGDAVLGAWDEVADQLRGRGLVVTTATSRRAVATRSEEVVGAEVARAVDELALLANAVSFSATAPPEHLGRAAWAIVDHVRAGLRRDRPWWDAAWRAADPRTLRRPRTPVRSARPAPPRSAPT